jgi:cytochrome c peroxidase
VRAFGPTLAVLLTVAAACGDGGTENSTPIRSETPNLDLTQLANYASPAWPVHYDALVRGQDNAPPGNPVTDRGATLGRVLFHDTKLSINNTLSCASCHQRRSGFTDPARFSLGADGTTRTTAHAMRLANARFFTQGQAFWDRRAPTLEAQASVPILNGGEMGFDAAHGGVDSLISKMQDLSYYPDLFAFVYGDPAITEDRIQRAIAQYVRSIVSLDSRFDREFAKVFNPGLPDRGINAPFPGFTAQENRGKQLFLLAPPSGGGGCGSCHMVPTFALGGSSRSNGLDAGEARIFKAPSLKNVAVTGPYMHDGRFATLEQVVEHYVSGVKEGPALDVRLRGPGGVPQRLPFTATDKVAVVSFLKTLSDPGVISDPKFGDPFLP